MSDTSTSLSLEAVLRDYEANADRAVRLRDHALSEADEAHENLLRGIKGTFDAATHAIWHKHRVAGRPAKEAFKAALTSMHEQLKQGTLDLEERHSARRQSIEASKGDCTLRPQRDAYQLALAQMERQFQREHEALTAQINALSTQADSSFESAMEPVQAQCKQELTLAQKILAESQKQADEIHRQTCQAAQEAYERTIGECLIRWRSHGGQTHCPIGFVGL